MEMLLLALSKVTLSFSLLEMISLQVFWDSITGDGRLLSSSFGSREPASGEEVIVIRVSLPTPGIWTFFVEAVGGSYNGTFHMWLPITQFMNVPIQFLEASPYITLTEPAMARDIISVSTYNAANNSFYIDSGR